MAGGLGPLGADKAQVRSVGFGAVWCLNLCFGVPLVCFCYILL